MHLLIRVLRAVSKKSKSDSSESTENSETDRNTEALPGKSRSSFNNRTGLFVSCVPFLLVSVSAQETEREYWPKRWGNQMLGNDLEVQFFLKPHCTSIDPDVGDQEQIRCNNFKEKPHCIGEKKYECKWDEGPDKNNKYFQMLNCPD